MLERVRAEDRGAAAERVAQEGRTPVRVDGDDTCPGRFDREVGTRAVLACDPKRERRARRDVAERLHELEHHDVVLDRIDEAVAKCVTDAEDARRAT